MDNIETIFTTLEVLPVAAGLSTLDGMVLFVNQKFKEIIGYTVKDITENYDITPDIRLLFPSLKTGGENKSRSKNILVINDEEKEQKRTETIRSKSGNELVVEIISKIKGQTIYSVFNDITAKHRLYKQLKDSENRYRTLFDNANDGVIVLHENKLFDFNKKTLEIYGCTRAQFKQQLAYHLSPEYQPNGRLSVELAKEKIRLAHAGKQQHFEWLHKRWDGTEFEAEITLSRVIFNSETYIFSVIRDITKQKNAEKSLHEKKLALRKSENLLRTVIDAIPFNIWVKNIDNKIILQNKSSLDTWGTLNSDWIEKIDDKLKKKIFQEVEEVINKKPVDKEFEYKTGKKHYYFRKVLTPLIENEEVWGAVGMTIDITEQRQAEHKILNAIIQTEEKERTVFAQELHDGLGPLISAIKMYVEWLAKPGIKANRQDIVDKIGATIDEAVNVTKEISNNLSPHVLKNFGLEPALKSFADRLKDIRKTRVKIQSNLKKRLPEINEVIIYRVLTECINNTQKHAKAKSIYITIHHNQDNVNILYSDDGIGFDFDKIISRNKGFGLLNIKHRLKSIGAKVKILTNPDEGFNLKIDLKV